MYDYLIVGSGIFGSTFAHQAKLAGKKCLVIDRREHIAGNCYTRREGEIDVHVYGPHIFHTSNKEVWDFVNKFSSFNSFVNRPKSRVGDKIFSFPINLMTLHQLWGVSTPDEARRKLEEVQRPCSNPRNLEEWIVSQVGIEIYEKFIYGYTKKQWMREPRDLPASIIRRLPIRLTYDDNYFTDTYQGIPVNGYTGIFESMLDGVETQLGVDFFLERQKLEKMCKRIVYTGKIDEFFNFEFGDLQYRGLEFQTESHPGDFQGNAVINYPSQEIPWTRITEHMHFTPERKVTHNTIVTKEFPHECVRGDTPYYPIGDETNMSKLQEYKKLSTACTNVVFGGRLAEYRYYDMHQVIASALHVSKKELA